MLVRNKKTFNLGVVFTISFLGVLALIFSPIFNGENGLVFSDNSFNKLAKGSSYFIPKIAKSIEKVAGESVSIDIKIDKIEQSENIAKLFTVAGATAIVNGQKIKVEGNLGIILQSALKDADSMYKNDGKTISDRYGYEEKIVMKNWWAALSSIERSLKRDKLVAEAKVVSGVIKKAIEPGYNFYQIDANKVADHAGMMSGLLIFYVVYTMWWGYAIFYLFDGIGLSMKKAKVKEEA